MDKLLTYLKDLRSVSPRSEDKYRIMHLEDKMRHNMGTLVSNNKLKSVITSSFLAYHQLDWYESGAFRTLFISPPTTWNSSFFTRLSCSSLVKFVSTPFCFTHSGFNNVRMLAFRTVLETTYHF